MKGSYTRIGASGMPTCRLCGGLKHTRKTGKFVQYGPSHYAHQVCYLEAGKSFDALTPERRAEFPRWLLRKYGLVQEG